MAIPWNEDHPRDAAVIAQNLADLVREIAQQASLRRPPTVAMAQEWHRRIYDGMRLPVPSTRARYATAILSSQSFTVTR